MRTASPNPEKVHQEVRDVVYLLHTTCESDEVFHSNLIRRAEAESGVHLLRATFFREFAGQDVAAMREQAHRRVACELFTQEIERQVEEVRLAPLVPGLLRRAAVRRLKRRRYETEDQATQDRLWARAGALIEVYDERPGTVP